LLPPLTRSVSSTGAEGSCGADEVDAAPAALAASGATAVPAAAVMNVRRLNPDVGKSLFLVMTASAAKKRATHACAFSF
jgi:hypothetical protein